VKFGIASLILYVAWHVGPVYVAHRQLKTDVVQATRDHGRGSEEELLTAVLAAANRVGALVDSDDIQVHKDDTYRYVRLTYTEPLQLLPTRGRSRSTLRGWPSRHRSGTNHRREAEACRARRDPRCDSHADVIRRGAQADEPGAAAAIGRTVGRSLSRTGPPAAVAGRE